MADGIFSVYDLNAYIRSLFLKDSRLSILKVEGELSNVKYHSSGHIYFTLKDDKSQIAGVMFAGNRKRGLSFTLEEGMSVIVTGEVSVYERDGKYQIYASSFTKSGKGKLYEEFERLKLELAEMGIFDNGYKQELPKYIKRLGVVTAPTGAVIRDIINISTRRFPYIEIILYPAKVQGEGASDTIVSGIEALDNYGVDTIIVGRGGGSIEDLWAFNERDVAMAIFNCRTPIISAVGHETDVTIADFAADLRAPTPSAAAELAVFDYEAYIDSLLGYKNRLTQLLEGKVAEKKSQLRLLEGSLRQLSPANKLREQRMLLDSYYDRLNARMNSKLVDSKADIAVLIERLRGLDPLLKLSQGFSMAEDDKGRLINSVKTIDKDDKVIIHVSDGDIYTKVIKTEEVDRCL